MSGVHSQSGQDNGQGAGDDKSQAGTGAEQTNTQGAQAPSALDLKTATADQLTDILENPAFWNLPRVKELREAKDKLKTFEEEKSQQETKSLEEQKKFEELANKFKGENETLKSQLEKLSMDQTLSNQLQKEGVVDLEAALALIDRSGISNKDGKLSGVEDAIKNLKEGKAYLFNGQGQSNQSLGTATNNNGSENNQGQVKFKRSQLKDSKFYQEHREEILKAQAAGLIEDDL